MKRRTFIAGLGSAAAWPVVAGAQQQTDKVWRVGYLTVTSASDLSVAYFDDFRLKLKDDGAELAHAERALLGGTVVPLPTRR